MAKFSGKYLKKDLGTVEANSLGEARDKFFEKVNDDDKNGNNLFVELVPETQTDKKVDS